MRVRVRMLCDTKTCATHHHQSAHYSSTPILTQGGINPDIWSPGGNCENINREENTGDFGKVRNICELWVVQYVCKKLWSQQTLCRTELWVARNCGLHRTACHTKRWVTPNTGSHQMLGPPNARLNQMLGCTECLLNQIK